MSDTDVEIHSDDEIVDVVLRSPFVTKDARYLKTNTKLRVTRRQMNECTAMKLDQPELKPEPIDLTKTDRIDIVSAPTLAPQSRPEPVSLVDSKKTPKLTGHGSGKVAPATVEEVVAAAKGIDLETIPDQLTAKGFIKQAYLETVTGKAIDQKVYFAYMNQAKSD